MFRESLQQGLIRYRLHESVLKLGTYFAFWVCDDTSDRRKFLTAAISTNTNDALSKNWLYKTLGLKSSFLDIYFNPAAAWILDFDMLLKENFIEEGIPFYVEPKVYLEVLPRISRIGSAVILEDYTRKNVPKQILA